MKTKVFAAAFALLATSPLALTAPSYAALPVVDFGSIAQMLNQVKVATSQLTQLQSQLKAQQNMLATLTSNISPQLGSIVSDATQVMKTANGIGYSAKSLTSQLSSIYPKDMLGKTLEEITSAQADWQTRSSDTRQQAMEAQNAVFKSQDLTQNEVSGAVGASQGAIGQTQAIQATNQLLAALSTQLTGLQTLLLTQMRAAQTAEAERVSLRAAGQAKTTMGLGNSTRNANAPAF